MTDKYRFVYVDEPFLLAGATSGVGWTHAQIRLLGEEPTKGWRQRAIGRMIPVVDAERFLYEARRPKNRPARRINLRAEAMARQPVRAAAMTSPAQVRRSAPNDRQPVIPVSPIHRYGDVPPWE